jgi:hypothetical protein
MDCLAFLSARTYQSSRRRPFGDALQGDDYPVEFTRMAIRSCRHVCTGDASHNRWRSLHEAARHPDAGYRDKGTGPNQPRGTLTLSRSCSYPSSPP